MGRMIFVPQYPAPMRYQEWWITEFVKEFEKHFDEVIVLGSMDLVNNKNVDYGKIFSPIDTSIKFELSQIRDYMNINIFDDDILFFSDLSFPGFFANVLHHKKPKKCFAFCHGTSINNFDYFQKVRESKWQVECGQAKMFDKIFVGSNYHKNKLGWDNTEVVALPEPPINVIGIESLLDKYEKEIKPINIFSASRPTEQKVTKELEDEVEKVYGKIKRQTFDNWSDYYSCLGQTKVLLISSKEDTFGLQAMDAILAGCIPIAPNKFSYPELLPREYLYDDLDELMDTLALGLNGHLPVPELLCQDLVDNFYDNIIGIMKGE